MALRKKYAEHNSTDGIMKISSRIYLKNENFRCDLLRRLNGRVFHVTTAAAFENIQRDNFIFHNKSGRFPIHTSSEISFGRKNGWVCLFDLRCQSDDAIQDALEKYDFLRPDWLVDHELDQTVSHLAYLFLHPEKYSVLIPNSQGQLCDFFIPKVECWYPGDMPLDNIEEVLFVRIAENAPADPISRILYNIENGL